MLDKIEALQERMDRIHVLMTVTGKSMEELMSIGANYFVDCNNCPIRHHCVASQLKVNKETGLYYTCEELWVLYLKGVIDAEKA